MIIKLYIHIVIVLILASSCLFAKDISSKKDSTARTDTSIGIIEEVKEFSQKDNIFSKLLRNIFVEDDYDEEDIKEHERVQRTYINRYIRNINITVLDVFGPSIRFPDRDAKSLVQKAGNALHITTRVWLIRNRLLFSKGERLSVYGLTESERLLRESGYVYDARIRPVAVKGSKDSVDIVVTVQDIWSISGGAAYSPAKNEGRLMLKDINFLGLGSELSGEIKQNNRVPGKLFWNSSFSSSDFTRFYITGRIFHYSDEFRRLYGLSVNRDFYTPLIRYAGGIGVEWEEQNVNISDTLPLKRLYSLSRQDAWAGYAFDFTPFNVRSVNQNRLNLALRVIQTNYTSISPLDTLGVFESNTFYLSRFGYAQRKFERESHIFGLGRTEDIPVGGMAELLFGFSEGRKTDLRYYGLRAGRAMYGRYGYFFGGVQAGAFRNGSGGFRNGVTALEMFYFTRLLSMLGISWRHYAWARYAYRHDPLHEAELLDLRDTDALRGYQGPETGSHRLTFNYENSIFLPWNVLGFKTAVIGFADFALISSENSSLFSSRLFQGYGLGLRFRNEHLVFPIVRLMAGYYTGGKEYFRVFTQHNIYYRMQTFQFSRPEMVNFY